MIFINNLIKGNKGFLITFLLILILFVLSILSHDLLMPDEGRYATIAYSMLETKNYSTPIINGMPFFHKPPLFYWLTELGFYIFGDNVFSARIASFISALLLIISIYFFMKKYFNVNIALTSMLLTAIGPGIWIGQQYANTDTLVGSMVTITVLSVVDYIYTLENGKNSKWLYYKIYIFAALGFLAKGLIGFVLPGLVILIWILISRRYKYILKLLNIKGLLVFLLISSPWLVYMQVNYPNFLEYYFIDQQFGRYLSSKDFNNKRNFFFYVPILLIATMPSCFAIILNILKNKSIKVDIKEISNNYKITHFNSLLLIWFLATLIFFSIPKSKLILYTVVMYAPIFIYASLVLHNTINILNKKINIVNIMFIVNILLFIVTVCIVSLRPIAHSTAKLTKQLKKEGLITTSTIIFSTGRYIYDYALYSGDTRPVILAGLKDNRDIESHDNWARELYDASKFSPELAKKIIISYEDLSNIICNDSNPKIIFMNKHEDYTYNSKINILYNSVPYLESNYFKVFYFKDNNISLCK